MQGTKIPFIMIGSDAGLLSAPVTTSSLDISMAERWELIFDFSPYAGKNITLKNGTWCLLKCIRRRCCQYTIGFKFDCLPQCLFT